MMLRRTRRNANATAEWGIGPPGVH